MADHYQSFSVVIDCTLEQAGALVSALLSQDEEETGEEPWSAPEWCQIADEKKGGVWLAGDNGLDEEVIQRISQWQINHKIPAFGIEFADHCSKHRTDSFGGFAMLFRDGNMSVYSTGHWLADQLNPPF